MNAAELTEQILAAKRAMDNAELEHRQRVREAAEADKAFRIAESKAYIQASGTVGERAAVAKLRSADERYKLKLAEGLESSALEAIRNARQFLSALQSLAAATREEANLARYMDQGGL